MFKNNHMTVSLKVARPQTALKPSETFRNLPPELTPPHTGLSRTFRNLPPGTHTSIRRNPPEPSGTCQHTQTRRNYTSTPKPSGTCPRNLRNLPEHPSGTSRNIPPEPAPAHPETLRNLRNLLPHTPELTWAEDPISLQKHSIPWLKANHALPIWRHILRRR